MIFPGLTNRVLVVDDEPIIRMVLAENLADAGYAVTAARNGREALNRALEQPSDLVVLDLLMPEVDGFMFLRERLADPNLARVPVVVLSAAGIEDLRHAWHLHATAVLSKPVDLEVLSAVIEHVLREWRREPRPPKPARIPVALWLYPELYRDWGVLDRTPVHSIDSALDCAALHRLWHEAVSCSWPACRHAP